MINFDDDQLQVIYEALDREVDRLGGLMDYTASFSKERFLMLQAKRNDAKVAMGLIAKDLGMDKPQD